jgi:hypothetical protein
MIAQTTFTVPFHEIDTHQRLARLLYGQKAYDHNYATATASYVKATAIAIPWLDDEPPIAIPWLDVEALVARVPRFDFRAFAARLVSAFKTSAIVAISAIVVLAIVVATLVLLTGNAAAAAPAAAAPSVPHDDLFLQVKDFLSVMFAIATGQPTG